MAGPVVSVLTIAGSDSSGGAGIQADLKTIAAHGCYGTSAITALTSQNTTGVQAIHPSPPEFVEQQIASILSDIPAQGIKTGMLYDEKNIKAVVGALKKRYAGTLPPNLVCDPVCVSTSGHNLLELRAVRSLIEELFPLATLITPNKSESELLLSESGQPLQIENVTDMLSAAEKLLQLGPSAVLVKGGHVVTDMTEVIRVCSERPDVRIARYGLLDENMEILLVNGAGFRADKLVVDVLCERDEKFTLYIRPRIESSSTHGTGCTLSSAIASELALGAELEEAVERAVIYTYLGIVNAQPIGRGHGPLNHMHSLSPRLIPSPTKDDPYPFTQWLIQRNAKEWKQYVEHDFVKLLGRGTLSSKAFLYFMKQDYHYLKYYARAYGLLAAKSSSFAAIHSATETILYIIREIDTHRAFCLSFGVGEEELDKTPEEPATMAYGAYLLDMGLQGDSTKLLMALLACLLGYGEVGLWLKKQSQEPNGWVKIEGNPYKKWIEDYSGQHYQQAVKVGLDVIESRALNDPPSPLRLSEWRQVWERCTKLETDFWDAAMAAASRNGA